LVEEGDAVKEGQVMARLMSRDIDIQLEQNTASLARNDALVAQARNQIEQARISREKAEADLARTNRLRRSGVSTIEQQDQRQSAFDIAVAQQEAAQFSLASAEADRKLIEAQREELELRKSRTEIKAPVDGYVSRRRVEYGMVSSSQGDPMFHIVAKSLLKLVAEVPEADLPKVALGMKADVTANGYDKTFAGEVALISPFVNEQTRMGSVHIRMSEGTRLPLSAFGRASIALATEEGVTVPMTAVTFGKDGPTVQVVSNGRVEVRPVKTGLVSAEEIEINEGLAEGETYVARAGSFVRDGDTVNPVPLALNATN
jgi:HlyD family secretion protein